ncbi:hypothetical protein KL930_000042 [Ogataea haglerorum]|uniref:Uncharacterized protein n=1 Tax=Ogataea haglerorum TaxID=1937702 RepID=A0AAN6I098_9ASCO|nr:uncharacterized protein KL911_001092 [Ogataea haglerorum]KAG7697904.1 hypothetical protein KL951_002478 [Ogataea haglerorum]KAG7701505.1 hypothetical protein KL915_000536 [Ogataea haglerorum]KAG7706724.1 hypothetical protein KL950_003389 [Ogataea haglerorum]KAG7709463.1 hypothetical protein KL914_001853 [Ogataea haglerorum]KAG7717673.1 hypothetical protein KL913_002609 [Ogataea haglerorum]
MEPSTTGFARHHSQAVLAHRSPSKRPVHRANLVRQNSGRKSQLFANRAHFASKSELRAIFNSRESLHDIPPYLVSYTLSPPRTQYEHNPVLKYAVARTRVANRQLFLDPTDMSIKDYMTPQSVELPPHLNKSLQIQFAVQQAEHDGGDQSGVKLRTLQQNQTGNIRQTHALERPGAISATK